jgi:hypothetical protein
MARRFTALRVFALLVIGFVSTVATGQSRDASETLRDRFQTALGDLDIPLTIRIIPPDYYLTAGNGNETASVHCALCSEQEAMAQAAFLGTRLKHQLQGQKPSSLHVPPLSTGIQLTIDGMWIPRDVRLVPLSAGTHRVALATDHLQVSADIALAPETTRPLNDTDFNATIGTRPLVRTAILTGGLGIGVAVAGGALLSINGECGQRDSDGTCEALHETAPFGTAMLITGACAVTAAVTLAIIAAVRIHRTRGLIRNATFVEQTP